MMGRSRRKSALRDLVSTVLELSLSKKRADVTVGVDS